MKAIGTLLALVCGGLGVLQVWAGSQRHAHEFASVPIASRLGILAFEFSGTPARLEELLDQAGERGRHALRRCLELDDLIIAGYMFVALGLSGVLTAVSRTGLARWVLVAGVVAAVFHVIENAGLRAAAVRHPEPPTTALITSLAAGLKFLALIVGVAAFFLWPFRTWFG